MTRMISTLLVSEAAKPKIPTPEGVPVTDKEFLLFQGLVKQCTGIFLPIHKKPLLVSRLGKRLLATQNSTFSQYYSFINQKSQAAERQLALELLTTNETYFFREPKHFAYLKDVIIPKWVGKGEMKVWSAACSSGEETYSIAMVLDEYCKTRWSLLGTDINTQMLEMARKGIYINERAEHIPQLLKHKYCKKGVDKYEGYMRVCSSLRDQIEFQQFNLMQSFGNISGYDLVFLRNVMIYFERSTQAEVISRISRCINPGGYLFTGHSESLHGISHSFDIVQPAVYRKCL